MKESCNNCKHYTLYSKEAYTDINYCDDAKCRISASEWCKHYKKKKRKGER